MEDQLYEEFRKGQLEGNLEANREEVLEVGYLFANESSIEALDRIMEATDPKAGYYGLLLILISEKIRELDAVSLEPQILQ